MGGVMDSGRPTRLDGAVSAAETLSSHLGVILRANLTRIALQHSSHPLGLPASLSN